MNEFEKLCRDAYYSKRNVFDYQGKGYHLMFLVKRVRGHGIVYAVQARRVDDAGKHWINVGKPVSVEVIPE